MTRSACSKSWSCPVLMKDCFIGKILLFCTSSLVWLLLGVSLVFGRRQKDLSEVAGNWFCYGSVRWGLRNFSNFGESLIVPSAESCLFLLQCSYPCFMVFGVWKHSQYFCHKKNSLAALARFWLLALSDYSSFG